MTSLCYVRVCYCLSLVGSPERRKIFLLLLSRLLSITHTHTRTLDDAEIKIDSRQSERERERGGEVFLLPCCVLVLLRATRKKVEFCCHVCY